MAAASTTVKIPVIMTDGSTVEFNTKQKVVKTSTIDDDTGVIATRFDFSNGEVRNFTTPSELILRFAAHGVEQKLGDVIAGKGDMDDAILAFDDLLARLVAGDWTAPRSADSFAGASVLLRALVEVSGRTVEEIKAYLLPKTQAEKVALRGTDQLRPVVARLEAEKASKSKSTVDTSALLGELGITAGEGKPAKK